ncbi:unnamed protein product [Polarella glacialis]|uniref:Uncharacterized protein n=1 Tax=Polarella glacialis TaxID=89957 RepID=A0A813K7I8_POLGL|nr:unnamed protein product [Polarella glacialis]
MARVFRSARPAAVALAAAGGCGFALHRWYSPASTPSRVFHHQQLQLSRLITEERVRQLEDNGFLVIEDAGQQVLGGASSLAGAREDVQALKAAGSFAPGRNRGKKVRDDVVCWLTSRDLSLGADLVEYMHLLEGLACELERHGYRGSFAHQVPQLLQLSCYPAGSSHSYDRHLDCNLQSVFDLGVLAWLRATGNRARVLTAMVYLNDEDWLPSSTANSPGGHDGGELRVFHGVQWFPLATDAGAGEWRDYTDITPRGEHSDLQQLLSQSEVERDRYSALWRPTDASNQGSVDDQPKFDVGSTWPPPVDSAATSQVQWTVAAAAAAGLAGGDAILRQLALMQSAGYPVAAAQAHLPPYAQAAQPVRGQAAERELVAVGHAPLRNAIMRFYHEHRPEKLTERDFIDFICSVYEGREAELDEALRQKYGTGLRLPSGAPPQLAQAALSAAALAQAADLASRQRAAAAVASAPLGLGVAGFQAPMLEPAYAGLQEAWLAQAAASAPAAAAAAAAASAATAAASAAAVARAQAAQKSAQLAEQRAMQWMHQNAAELYPALPFLPFPVAGALHDDTVKDYSEGPDFSWIDQIVGGEEASEEVQKRREAQAASPDRRMVRVR